MLGSDISRKFIESVTDRIARLARVEVMSSPEGLNSADLKDNDRKGNTKQEEELV